MISTILLRLIIPFHSYLRLSDCLASVVCSSLRGRTGPCRSNCQQWVEHIMVLSVLKLSPIVLIKASSLNNLKLQILALDYLGRGRVLSIKVIVEVQSIVDVDKV